MQNLLPRAAVLLFDGQHELLTKLVVSFLSPAEKSHAGRLYTLRKIVFLTRLFEDKEYEEMLKVIHRLLD